jgi:hypothetical protein
MSVNGFRPTFIINPKNAFILETMPIPNGPQALLKFHNFISHLPVCFYINVIQKIITET